MSFLFEECRSYCKTMLGEPVVNVELTDDHYQLIYNDMLEILCYNKPKISYVNLTVASGQVSYTVTGYGYDVIDVQVPPAEIYTTQQFDIFNPMLVSHPSNIADYQLSRMYADDLRKVMSADFEWDFDKDTGELLISPIPTASYTAVLVCVNSLTGGDIKNPWLKRLCKKFALAKAKQILGIIRRKVKSIEGTELTFELDGSELLEEGNALEDAFIQELKEHSGDFVAPVVA